MADTKEVVLQKCKNAIDCGEPIMDYSFYYRVIELLKEQDAVEPVRQIEQTEWTVCGNCHKHIISKWTFCPHCGRSVKL